MNTSSGGGANSNYLFLQTAGTTSQPQMWNGPPGQLGSSYTAITLTPGPVTDGVERARARKAIEDLEKEHARIKARQESPPMHWWSPDRSGHVCAICDFDNIYRGAPLQHMPLIKEDPELEDRWRELGAA